MPMINIEYDGVKVKKEEVRELSKSIQKIVSEATQIKDVFVYTNSSEITVKIAPIEIFVRMSDTKITNADQLFQDIKSKLSAWKKESNFKHPINLTLIPMKWKFETGL